MTKQRWHELPDHRVEFAKLMENPVMQDALGVLQEEAVVSAKTADVTILALEYKRLEGYQQAINDLLSLARVPKTAKQKPAPFVHLQETNQ